MNSADDIVAKYRKLFHFEKGTVGYTWLDDMAKELLGLKTSKQASYEQNPCHNCHKPVDCLPDKPCEDKKTWLRLRMKPDPNEYCDTATSPEIEKEIVEYCINVLGLTFGEFWYEWYDSCKEGNHILILKSKNVQLTKEKILETFPSLSFVKEVIEKIGIYSTTLDEEGFKFGHRIQFRTKDVPVH